MLTSAAVLLALAPLAWSAPLAQSPLPEERPFQTVAALMSLTP